MECSPFADMGPPWYVPLISVPERIVKPQSLGTGKTTVVVQILRSILLTFNDGVRPKILMTASTHNGTYVVPKLDGRDDEEDISSCRQRS